MAKGASQHGMLPSVNIIYHSTDDELCGNPWDQTQIILKRSKIYFV